MNINYNFKINNLLVIHLLFKKSLVKLFISRSKVCSTGGFVTGLTLSTTLLLFLARLRTPVAHGTQVPQHAQQHPQHVKGRNIAAIHCNMQTEPILSWPGLVLVSSIAPDIHESYLPKHPPHPMQQGIQHRASSDNNAKAFIVLQQVNSDVVTTVVDAILIFL